MKREEQRDVACRRCLKVKNRRWGPLLCALLVLAALEAIAHAGLGKGSKDEDAPKVGTVIAVLDGDTVLLENGSKVRYLGVDTPEMDHETGRHECYAREAYERNKAMVLGRRVVLAYEAPIRDEHGRLLAYVSSPEGISVNAELIREGLAYVFRGAEGFSRFPEFLALQRDAVVARRGMYGRCPVREENSYLGNRASFIFHRPTCPFGAKTHPNRRIVFSSRWDALMEGYRPCRRCSP